MTPLQRALTALYLLLEDARDRLDEETYEAFVFVATERIGIEAARLAVGEAVRAKRAAA